MDELILRKHEYTIRAKQILKRTAEDIVELSQIAYGYRDEFGFQEYIEWVNNELGLSRRYGCGLLKVYENFKSSAPGALIPNFDSSAIRLLSESSESAREEAFERAELGEDITKSKAQEIISRHKAEAEAAKREAAEAKKESSSKQQAITSLEDQIISLEADRTRLRKENDQVIRNKSADDAAIIRQEENYRKVTKELEELRAKVAQPQVIEKEVKVEVEKRIEVIPEDYDVLKVEVNTLKEKLKTSKQKSGEELSQYQRRVNDLSKRLAQKEEALASFDVEQKQLKAFRKLSEGQNCILEAMRLLEGSYLSQPRLQETIIEHLKAIQKNIDKFHDLVGTIDLEVIYEQN